MTAGFGAEPETLAALVEAQAVRTPDAVAAIHGSARLTYAELVTAAREIAGELVRLGVGPDVAVGICAERSLFLTVGLLGILEAGGACLPLDPAYPKARLDQMLADAAPRVVMVTAATVSRLPQSAEPVLRLDTLCASGQGSSAAAPTPADGRASADDLAYLIYTSGSTGEPKGVMLTNAGLAHHAAAVARLYDLGPDDRVLQFASIGFDVSIEEIFPTLATGGAVLVRDETVPILGGAWLEWLATNGPTILNLPTAHWHEWVRDLRALGRTVPSCVRLVVVGGERALGSAYAIWQQVGGDRVRWINAYGPAEASVTATAFEGPRGGDWPAEVDPPIGRAVGATTTHVLDAHGRQVLDGTAGELHLGGPGLARGYLGRPGLTDESFVTAPDLPGERLYRTGDLTRVLGDGTLAYLGRLDEQVKIRGVRIEPGDIEAAIARHPRVREAAVIAPADASGNRRLVAYVVPDDTLGASAAAGATTTAPLAAPELRRFLAMRLPRQMMPADFIVLGRLPLTPSGKVDRASLPVPGESPRSLTAASDRPRTETEAAIARVWSDILGVSALGRDEDFFDLGGQSLQAAQIVAMARDMLGVDIGMSALFDAPTVAGFAAGIDARRSPRVYAPPLEQAPHPPEQRIPLALPQEHMWRMEAVANPPGLYNVTAMHTFDASVDSGALDAALAYMVDRHSMLRTYFVIDAGTPRQMIAPQVAVELDVHDLTLVAEEERAAELGRLVAAQDAAPLDHEHAPLLRVSLYLLRSDRALLATTFDHLVCDGTSAYIFLSEVIAAYEAFREGRQPGLPALPVQYADYAVWQHQWLTGEVLAGQVDYWKRALAGMRLGPAVPFDHVPAAPTRRIVARDIAVNADLYSGVRRLARTARATVFVVVAAAFQALCNRASGQTDVVMSTTLSGRRRAEVARLIGCFHTVGRIRTDLSGDPPFSQVVTRTRAAVAALLDNSDVPFFRIREAAIPPMPGGGGASFLAAVPTELQYFPAARDEWAPGAGVVERSGPDRGPDEIYFRGHMHPLVVTLLDDGAQLWGSFSYKVDWYDETTIEALADALVRTLGAVVADPSLRLSQLPAGSVGSR